MRTSLFANAGFIVGGLAAGLLLGELTLRVFGVSYPIFYRADYYLGQAPRPGAQGWQVSEGRAYIRFNDAGFRDLEHVRQKPDDTFRIAILGDSYADALQVPIQQTFWKVIEENLSRCPELANRKIEIINFGVSGYGTAQELIMLRRYGWAYAPDLVVLLFTTGNDLRDNSAVLDPMKMRPFFEFRNGVLVLDNSFRNSARFRFSTSWLWRAICRVTDYSRIVQLAFHSVVVVHEAQRSRITEGHGEELGLDSMVYREPADGAWQDAWQVTETLLAMMKEETRANHAEFLLVTGTSGVQVDPDPLALRAFSEQLEVPDLFYPDRRIAALGVRDGFEVLNLAQPFQAYAQLNHVYLHGFKNTRMGGGHWNADGHRLAGEMIARKICEMQLTLARYPAANPVRHVATNP